MRRWRRCSPHFSLLAPLGHHVEQQHSDQTTINGPTVDAELCMRCRYLRDISPLGSTIPSISRPSASITKGHDAESCCGWSGIRHNGRPVRPDLQLVERRERSSTMEDRQQVTQAAYMQAGPLYPHQSAPVRACLALENISRISMATAGVSSTSLTRRQPTPSDYPSLVTTRSCTAPTCRKEPWALIETSTCD